MKLVYSELVQIFLFLFQWMDYPCSCLPSTHYNLFRVVVYKVSVIVSLPFFFSMLNCSSFFDFLIFYVFLF